MTLTTTVIGSYPLDRPSPQQLRPAAGQGRFLAPDEALARAVNDQIEAGIQLISDGEVRDNMMDLFAPHLAGFEKGKPKGWLITGRVGPSDHGVTVEDWRTANRLADGRAEVKGIITGPTTIAMSAKTAPESPYASNADPELIYDIARALAEEAKALRAAGARVIQVDEPFFAYGADVAVGLKAVDIILREAEFPVLHSCGDTRPILAQLLAAPVAVVEVEGKYLADVPTQANRAILESKGLKIGFGCLDTATDEVETVESLVQRIGAAADQLGLENMWVNPECGMRLRKRNAAFAKLQNLVAAANIVDEGGNEAQT
jgi:5-methyltetrahydropteroyltriglutamate--homocysteine methyltransferase